MQWLPKIKRALFTALLLALLTTLLGPGGALPGDPFERLRAYTRQIEFDYAGWTWQALGVKGVQTALNLPAYQSADQQLQVVNDYLALIQEIQLNDGVIDQIFASPDIDNPQQTAVPFLQKRDQLNEQRSRLEPLCESILQQQVSEAAAELGLTLIGQPLPPVLYRITPLPLALIVSPREVIRQDANISLLADLTIEQRIALEKQVENGMNVSALVVNIGGVGMYPTMVTTTTDLPWLLETIAHEWTHNYLTLRPLGLSYEKSPELRTMNETTASISGKEIARAVLAKYYPWLLPPEHVEEPAPQPAAPAEPQPEPTPPPFDFRAEMHTTRVTADELLAQGKIEEAESYMEARRKVFWEQGYQIRRLNQAYFAFHGAYADQPGGAAGSDPVGPAVRELRSRAGSLAAFINQIAWMSSYDQLQQALGDAGQTAITAP